MSDDWTDRIAGERMRVDKQFSDRVTASSFSNQQWGLVMTAVEFDIEGPEDPASASLVADTSKLSSIMPELDKVGRQGPMGAEPDASPDSSGGLLDGLKSAFGLGGGDGDDEQAAEAAELAQAYADELQAELESNGRWESVCSQAAGGQ